MRGYSAFTYLGSAQMLTAAYKTNFLRAGAALFIGALMGAVWIIGLVVAGKTYSFGFVYVKTYGLLIAITVFEVVFPIWIFGLVILGAPLWWLLHRLNVRGWLAATALGALLVFLVFVAIPTNVFGLLSSSDNLYAGDGGGATVVQGRLTAHGWKGMISDALLQAVGGACVGAVIWRTAYRRQATQAARM